MTSEHQEGQGGSRRSSAAGFISGKKQMIAIGVAAVALLAIFAAVALADRSGPGDALYRFELTVVEPVAGAFHFSSLGRAEYHHERLIERLIETRDVPLEMEAEPRAELIAPVAYNVAHHAQRVFEALEGRDDEEALEVGVNTLAVLELYISSFYPADTGASQALDAALDNGRTAFNAIRDAYRDRHTLPELEEMLVSEITVITDQAQSATPYTLGRVTESLYDILSLLGTQDVLGAFNIVFQIQIDLEKDRLIQSLLG